MQGKNATNVTFAAELQKLLNQRGIKPADLARQIEISHVAIGNYLKGRIPHGDILIQIAKYLGVSVDDLLFGPEENRKGPFKDLHLNNRDAEFDLATEELAEIRRCDPEAFRTVRDVIATYKKRTLGGVSSKIADVATGSQSAASELARRELQEQRQKLSIDAPSERKRERGRAGQKGIKRRPEFQGLAPKRPNDAS
jgi:transcriptional regulator with XRE-family HTH domain